MKPDNCPDVTKPLASAPSVSSSELVSAPDLKPGDSILSGDGNFYEIQGAYPAAETYFVQFKNGMAWHCPKDGRVLVKRANDKLSD